MGRENGSVMQDSVKCDRQTDLTKLIVTFQNFANAPKNGESQNFFVYEQNLNMEIDHKGT